MNGFDPEFLIPYIVSNVIAVLLLVTAWKSPRLARLAYAVLFIGAGIFNGSNAATQPAVYLMYADTALLAFYHDFIVGYFAQHAALFVGFIAICQVLIGVALALRGAILKAGVVGGITFLTCIAPLGFGSAFPATLIMAAGLWLLLRKPGQEYIWKRPAYKTKKEAYMLFI